MKRAKFIRKVNGWLDDLKKKAEQHERSRNTYLTYKNAVTELLEYIDQEGAALIDRDLLQGYRNMLAEKEQAGEIRLNTLNLKVTAVNKMLKDIKLRRYRINGKRGQQEQPLLRESEYRRLRETALRLGLNREALIMKVLTLTGIRISELSFFTVESLRESPDGIEVDNKGRKRLVPLPEGLSEEILNYARKEGTESGIIFHARNPEKLIDKSFLWRQLKRIAAEADVKPEKAHCHAFRQIYARRFLRERPGDIATLADLLGHASLNVTRRYVKFPDDEKKEIVNGIAECYPEQNPGD